MAPVEAAVAIVSSSCRSAFLSRLRLESSNALASQETDAVDGTRPQGREARGALTGNDDLNVFLRLETKVSCRHSREIVYGAGKGVDADDFDFEILGCFDVRARDQNM